MNKQSKKTFLGMPVNWNYKEVFHTMWNKDDDTIFPPKSFGIGWTINFHALLKSTRIIAAENSRSKKKKDK